MQSKENLTFIIDYLGCKVNSYEAECVANNLLSLGYKKFDNEKGKNPTVVIINTCAVTEKSEAKDKKIIRQYRKKYKKSILLVMGCFAQNNAEFIAEELKADIVIGTSNRDKIPDLINEFMKNKEPIIKHDSNNNIRKYENLSLDTYLERTRAYVKIQDGCDNYCTYCLIPYIRGRSRSRDKEEIFLEIERLINNGYKEIVLTGIDMGSYGEDNYESYRFSDLLEDILKKFPNLYRLRISSLEESQIDEKFFNCLKKYPNLANHLHIPLQSGSSNILKKMNRKYDLTNFVAKIKKIRSIRKDIAISTDIIVGFPGETDDDFNDTYEFAKKIKFSKIHVFPYSNRKGTIADRLDNQVDEIDKKVRVTKLIALSDKLAYEYNMKFNDTDVEFLVEAYDESKKAYKAHSSNYLEYYIKSDEDIKGKIVTSKYKVETSINFDNVKTIFSR